VKYQAVLFDLLTALLDSWSLWNRVAGSDAIGLAWRTRYLKLAYQAGPYRPCEDIIREAAQAEGLPAARAEELIRRWSELEPWPETYAVLRALLERLSVAVVTNSSKVLATRALAALGVPVPIVVTAEDAGFYKSHPQPYRLALQRLGCEPASTLFVAGSPGDVAGAAAVGMPVFWHNRRGLSAAPLQAAPRHECDSLWPLLELV
jgi:2-haloalkanoic acid dehalogenase type II